MQLFLARRYAQAFLNQIYDSLQLADISNFERVVHFFETHKQACFFMDLSLLSDQTKQEALDAIIKTYELPLASKNLFSLLIVQKRSALIPQVLAYFIYLYKERANIICFTIQSSLELSDHDKTEIENFLKSQVQAVIICSYSVTPDLIAGVRIYNEKYLWEYSAQAQLRALQTSVRC